MEEFHKREDEINTKNENVFARWLTKGIDVVEKVTQIVVPPLTSQATVTTTPNTASTSLPSSGTAPGLICNHLIQPPMLSSPFLISATAQQLNNHPQLNFQNDNKLKPKAEVKKSKKDKKKKDKKRKKAKKNKTHHSKSSSREKRSEDNSTCQRAQDLRDLAVQILHHSSAVPLGSAMPSLSAENRKRS